MTLALTLLFTLNIYLNLKRVSLEKLKISTPKDDMARPSRTCVTPR